MFSNIRATTSKIPVTLIYNWTVLVIFIINNMLKTHANTHTHTHTHTYIYLLHWHYSPMRAFASIMDLLRSEATFLVS